MDIGPGDVVVCVDASDSPWGPSGLTDGARYTILHVWDPLPWKGVETAWMSAAVSLAEVPDPAPDMAWGIYRFKRIDGSELTGETLKAPAPELEPA